MRFTAGTRLRSAVDESEVIVVKAPDGEIDLRAGGHPLVSIDHDASAQRPVEAPFDKGCLLGKRYTNSSGDLEVLCTKAGPASLSIGEEPLVIKDAKPLPSSD